PAAPSTGGSLADAERERILSALAECRNNKTKAAEVLGISRRTLHRKLKEWGMQ
ncbi:MAG: helix-turn-helix domain-containing protein, partial [Kiritimatiellae bacterium]|nr:helix-turn-helix domain-containing protein [Kiritimatiellia bacterium]